MSLQRRTPLDDQCWLTAGILNATLLDFTTIPDRLRAAKQLPDGPPRGDTVARIVREMFEALPGVRVVDSDFLSGSGEAEFDIQLENGGHEEGMPGFQRDVFVEVKSSDKAIPSRDVGHFLRHIERRGVRWSIFVALGGVTGDFDDPRAAHHEIQDAAGKGFLLVVFGERELVAIRSPEHFAAVLERKRQKMVGTLRAVTLIEAEIKALDPNPRKGGVTFTTGIEGIRKAIRETHDTAITEVFDAALELEELQDDTARIDRAERALLDLDTAIHEHRQDPDVDPMWREIGEKLLIAGAAFSQLLDDDLADDDVRRRFRFDVRSRAPQQREASVGSELWALLSAYRLRQIRGTEAWKREGDVLAMIAMIVEEIIAIDNIDPRDVFGYPNEG